MQPTLPNLLTEIDVAEWLKMPAARVARLAKRKEIPCVMLPDGSILFDRADLTTWLATRRQGPVNPEVSHAG
jgi:hypothetical protein